jgi:hypothetical protein
MTDETATNQPIGHQLWEELAAGYALHALEPAEQELFIEHLEGCSTCPANVNDYSLVAAQLGSLTDVEPEEAPSWQDLRAGIVGQPAAVTSLSSRRHHRAQRILAAAAVVVMVAGGIAVWQANRGSNHGQPTVAALTACQQQAGCHAITLHTAAGASPAAVVVRGEQAAVVPLDLSTAPPGRTYVLWQMPRDGGPIPVSEFRDVGRQTAATRLPARYSNTAAFAISLESTASQPVKPTRVLALGSAA